MDEISVGIVTALPIEALAVYRVLDHLDDHDVSGDPNYYRTGSLPSTDPHRPHRVVVAQQVRDGTRNAAVVCGDLARSFPRLRVFVMCGIAGAVPAPMEAERHVRLGDIVVATDGVVDYDHVRTVAGVSELRRHAGAPSTTLLRVDNRLHTEELGGHRPWNDIIERLSHTAPFTRPDGHTDRLYVDGRVVQHPTDPQRPLDGPRVHRGVIGSADRLLRDAVMRDDLAARYRIRAVEMEGSGVAAAADLHERSWFMVRGAADYCDASKNDAWHPYAALVAAAYVRALLARCRPLPADGAVETRPPLQGLGAIVDALSVLPQMSEEPARRTLIRQLPDYVRTAVPENANPRLHVLNVIQTCTEFPGGEEFLLSALRITAGTSPEMSRIESIIRSNWPSR